MPDLQMIARGLLIIAAALTVLWWAVYAVFSAYYQAQSRFKNNQKTFDTNINLPPDLFIFLKEVTNYYSKKADFEVEKYRDL